MSDTDKIFDELIDEFSTWFDTEVEGYFKSSAFLDKAIQIVRGEVETCLALLYDTSLPFFKAIISRSKVSVNIDGDMCHFEYLFDFDDQDIVREWTNKGEEEPHTSTISSLDVADFFDKGRDSYTITGVNTKHKLLAIPRDNKAPYDPDDKTNVIVPKVIIPPLVGVKYKERAALALEEFVNNEYARIAGEIKGRIMGTWDTFAKKYQESSGL